MAGIDHDRVEGMAGVRRDGRATTEQDKDGSKNENE